MAVGWFVVLGHEKEIYLKTTNDHNIYINIYIYVFSNKQHQDTAVPFTRIPLYLFDGTTPPDGRPPR